MPQRSHLDCIIIGYHDIDFATVVQKLKKTQKYSGAYHNLKTNSVLLEGERISYMSLLNRVLSEATGRDRPLHVCELPNLGVHYLKNYLAKRHLNIEIVNFFTREKDRLLELLALSPYAVAITTTFYVDHSPIVEIVEFIRKHSPATKIIVGGPHIYNICSNQDIDTQDLIFSSIGADFYIHDSQGEDTLFRLLCELRRQKELDLNSIPNLIYTFENLFFYRTVRRIENNNLDENSIDWHYFERENYIPTTQMRTARSCAFACSFCRYPAFAGPLNLTGIPIIENELRMLQAAGVSNIVFVDDTFNVPLSRFKDICRMMIRNQFDFKWFSYFRCSNADDEAFDLMQRSGCKGVFLGIESGDQTILKAMNKFAKPSRYEYGIRHLKERGIITFASLIVGFPGETEETVRNTMSFIENTAPDFYRAELYYHDTKVPIQQRAAEYNLTGAGYSWRHSTMTWNEACNLIEMMYTNIQSSLVLPLYMFDFWSIPYLIGEGITSGQLSQFMSIAQRMLIQGLDDKVTDTRQQWEDLITIF
jgi:radical SAM PhpK family P-methyltransferase